MLNPGPAPGCGMCSHLEVINVFTVFKRFASSLEKKRAKWKDETEDWVRVNVAPVHITMRSCLMRNWDTEVLKYLGVNFRKSGKSLYRGARSFMTYGKNVRKSMDMGQAKQQHSPS
jgi:hypothetical protein